MLARDDLKDVVHGQHRARLQLNMLAYRKLPMAYTLFFSPLQCEIQVAIPVDNATDNVHVFLIQLINCIWTVRCQVNELRFIYASLIVHITLVMD